MRRNGVREGARAIFEAGLRAADPVAAVARALESQPLEPCAGRVLCIAVGKAARGMAEAAMGRLHPDATLIVTTHENARPLGGARLMEAGHPLPDADGAAAASAVEALARSARSEDHVLLLISGGASALLPAPIEGVSIEDKIRLNALLLGSGMPIGQMNLVRQNLSRLKGGGLARAIAPARCTALLLSDVIGDDPRMIASGLAAEPIGPPSLAREALHKAGIWADLPASVRSALSRPDTESAPLPEGCRNRIIGSNAHSVAAMAEAAPGAVRWPEPLLGDVADAARLIVQRTGPGTWLFGGETTVRLKGKGTGGRNQELALRVALEAERVGWPGGWAFLSGGSDGRDGPTDAAGGLVDGGTLARIRAAGIDPEAALAENDSHHALGAAGDLLITGPTGTNVADLQVLIRP